MTASKPSDIWKSPYQDRAILAIGIPLVTVCMTLIGTNNSLSDPESLFQLAVKLSYNLLIVGVLWMTVRQLIIFMDRTMPWEKGREFQRAFRQIPLVFFGMSLGFFPALILRTYLFDFWPVDWPEIWRTDFPLAILFLLLINFLYFYFWQQGHQPKLKEDLPESTTAATLKIKAIKGRSIALLDPDQINYAYREHEVNYIIDAEGVTYLWDESLATLETLLPDFFRLNRQYLVSRESVHTYSVKENRNLSVELKSQKERLAEVNKNRAAAFRRWLHQ